MQFVKPAHGFHGDGKITIQAALAQFVIYIIFKGSKLRKIIILP